MRGSRSKSNPKNPDSDLLVLAKEAEAGDVDTTGPSVIPLPSYTWPKAIDRVGKCVEFDSECFVVELKGEEWWVSSRP